MPALCQRIPSSGWSFPASSALTQATASSGVAASAVAGEALFAYGVDRAGPYSAIGLGLAVVALLALFVAGAFGLLDCPAH
jgi:hypothetical protein